MPSRRLDISPPNNQKNKIYIFFAGSVCHAWVGIFWLLFCSFHADHFTGLLAKKRKNCSSSVKLWPSFFYSWGGSPTRTCVCVCAREFVVYNIKNNVAITQLTSQRRPHFLALSFYI
jgi:hypothetical protein